MKIVVTKKRYEEMISMCSNEICHHYGRQKVEDVCLSVTEMILHKIFVDPSNKTNGNKPMFVFIDEAAEGGDETAMIASKDKKTWSIISLDKCSNCNCSSFNEIKTKNGKVRRFCKECKCEKFT